MDQYGGNAGGGMWPDRFAVFRCVRTTINSALRQLDVLQLEIDANANDRGWRLIDELAAGGAGNIELERKPYFIAIEAHCVITDIADASALRIKQVALVVIDPAAV